MTNKIVVFDLDETLGYFTELGMFWDIIQKYFEKDLGQLSFNKICDLFPDFFRPHIFVILKFIARKCKESSKNKVMIYTNNQGPKSWTLFIKNYIENKINYKLFNQIICAFKVRGKRIELCRSTHNKTYNDFVNCTKIPESTEICFLDDQMHDQMRNENVYYINVKPYFYSINFEDILDRFISSKIGKSLLKKYYRNQAILFKEKCLHEFKYYKHEYYKKSKKEHELDKIVSKKMMIHIQSFFKKKYNNGTKKKVKPANKKNKSRKKKS